MNKYIQHQFFKQLVRPQCLCLILRQQLFLIWLHFPSLLRLFVTTFIFLLFQSSALFVFFIFKYCSLWSLLSLIYAFLISTVFSFFFSFSGYFSLCKLPGDKKNLFFKKKKISSFWNELFVLSFSMIFTLIYHLLILFLFFKWVVSVLGCQVTMEQKCYYKLIIQEIAL